MAMMRRIAIDFAPPTLMRTLRRTPAWAWCLGAAGLGLCLAAGLGWHRSDQDQSAMREAITAADAGLAARQTRNLAKPAPPVPEAQALAVNKLVAQLNLPWGALLNAMEQASAPTVALLQFHPDPRNHQVKGIAEAKTSAAMIAYVERLKRQPVFDGVTLTKHEFADQDDSQPLRFEFEARWPEDRQ
jgi:hypothetical protein